MEGALNRQVATALRWSQGVLGVLEGALTPALSVGGRAGNMLPQHPGTGRDSAGERLLPRAREEPEWDPDQSRMREEVPDELLRRIERLARRLEDVLVQVSHEGRPVLVDDPWASACESLSEEL